MSLWKPKPPERDGRAIVIRFADAAPVVVPLTDASVFRIDGSSWSVVGVESITIEDAVLAALEADVFAPNDLGRPVSDWGNNG